MKKINLCKNDKYGDLIPIQEFMNDCKHNCFTDWDGWGYLSDGEYHDLNQIVYPSKVNERYFSNPDGFKYVLWYNK